MEQRDETIIVEVVNWEKYNPRGNERKSYHTHWYRVEDNLFSDPQFGDFSATDFCVMHYLFSLVCRKQGKRVILSLNFCSKAARTSKEEFLSGLDKLLKLNVVRLCADHRTIDRTLSYTQDKTRQDKTGQDTHASKPESNYQLSLSADADALPLATIWNELAVKKGLPSVVKITPTRKRQILSLLRENPNPNYWRQVIQRITDSSFCLGVTGKGNWSANFDWLLRKDTHIKVMEGHYDDKKRNQNAITVLPDDFFDDETEFAQ